MNPDHSFMLYINQVIIQSPFDLHRCCCFVT